MKTVLISGASIAGPTLAYWLARQGYAPTLVERAPAPRPGGQAIDVRGRALDVIDHMGLLDPLRALRTRMKGMSSLDAAGTEQWRTEDMTYSGGTIDNDDVELLRDDLAALLLDALPAGVERIFGDSITTLVEDEDGVSVSFEQGAPRRFDLVIGADGIHSNIRRLIFGDEGQYIHPLGFGLAIYTAPNLIDLRDWQIALDAGDRSCLIYTVRDNSELRICFTFPATLADEARGDVSAQKRLVANRARPFGWKIPALLDSMSTAADFYFGVMAQIKMTNWTKGRIALIGDAGYCPSPFSGQGTSLAIIGAYILAQELGRAGDDHEAAFAAYEMKMRPFVERNQAIATLSKTTDLADEEQRNQLLRVVDDAKNAILIDDPV